MTERPSVQLPTKVAETRGLIPGIVTKRQVRRALSSPARGLLGRIGLGIEPIGEFHRQIDALFDHAGASRLIRSGLAHLVEAFEQAVEMVSVKTLPKFGVTPRACEILIGDKFTHRTHSRGRTLEPECLRFLTAMAST